VGEAAVAREHVDVFDFVIIIIWSLTTIHKQDELGEDYTH
jgi:hypothetical protein